MLAFLSLLFEILFGGYATPPKCASILRSALNSYQNFIYFSVPYSVISLFRYSYLLLVAFSILTQTASQLSAGFALFREL